jgi:hypothetical protein
MLYEQNWLPCNSDWPPSAIRSDGGCCHCGATKNDTSSPGREWQMSAQCLALSWTLPHSTYITIDKAPKVRIRHGSREELHASKHDGIRRVSKA